MIYLKRPIQWRFSEPRVGHGSQVGRFESEFTNDVSPKLFKKTIKITTESELCLAEKVEFVKETKQPIYHNHYSLFLLFGGYEHYFSGTTSRESLKNAVHVSRATIYINIYLYAGSKLHSKSILKNILFDIFNYLLSYILKFVKNQSMLWLICCSNNVHLSNFNITDFF